MAASDDSDSASQLLLSAALGGLLCLAGACSGSKVPDASPASSCDGGSPNPSVTSTTIVASMTLDAFTSLCDAKNGVTEIQPHCGGSNSCRGMSYDTETETLSQHTCRGTNTCAGYSCVICD